MSGRVAITRRVCVEERSNQDWMAKFEELRKWSSPTRRLRVRIYKKEKDQEGFVLVHENPGSSGNTLDQCIESVCDSLDLFSVEAGLGLFITEAQVERILDGPTKQGYEVLADSDWLVEKSDSRSERA
jgi:hypothetical protein